MTRILSDLLGMPSLDFRQRINHLERLSGNSQTDIRLTTDILSRTHAKMRELGLDPNDTTAPELYNALQQRLREDERRFKQELGITDADTNSDLFAQIVKLLKKLPVPKDSFSLKASIAKKILKSNLPKKTMHRLGYRSGDSMIKHEPVAQVYSAGFLYESSQWRRDILAAYNSLQPSDFEVREIAILFPRAHRWEKFAQQFAQERYHHSVTHKELGSIVLLPVEESIPVLGITTMLLLVHDINAIRTASAYLKLQQVNPDFGRAISRIVSGNPSTNIRLAGQILPWSLVQFYYHTIQEAYEPALFEPHVQPEDLALAEAEKALAQSFPSLEFWQDTTGLAHIYNGHAVSLNMLDVALSTANRLDFSERIMTHVREQVWGELIARYLHLVGLDYMPEQIDDKNSRQKLEKEFAL